MNELRLIFLQCITWYYLIVLLSTKKLFKFFSISLKHNIFIKNCVFLRKNVGKIIPVKFLRLSNIVKFFYFCLHKNIYFLYI